MIYKSKDEHYIKLNTLKDDFQTELSKKLSENESRAIIRLNWESNLQFSQ